MNKLFLTALSLALVLGTASTSAAESTETPPPRTAYFGELHLHTAWSLDAYGFGNTLVGPDEAYRFAKGEPVALPDGGKTRITKPLDFAAVVEHSEWLGEAAMATDPTHPKYHAEFAKVVRARDEHTFGAILAAENSGRRPVEFSGENGEFAAAAAKTVWARYLEIADRHYIPGKFTTLHAFEWTAAPDGNNLHRNVFFRGQAPDMPTSWFEAPHVEDLWEWMETVGGGPDAVLAIPHNSNMSGGLMFRPTYSDGTPMDEAYAARRAINEPLFEIMQAKGASESTPRFAPNDEFIDFELMGDLNFMGPIEPSPHSWIREALKDGLALERDLGTNPFRYGIVAATDQHNGLTGDTDEYDFNGSHGMSDASPTQRLTGTAEVFDLSTLNPGGLTGVWADSNTREGIWDAMRRKETFGTSGTRLRIHFFAGDQLKAAHAKGDLIAHGYAHGAPMGSSLKSPAQRSPGFLVWAIKDVDSANLDRIQIIKGWLDEAGELHERIYDVTWSGDRQRDAAGKLPAVGNTVDVERAIYTNTIGSAQLSAFWQDPDYDPANSAFYYARVLEIPTPRWTTIDAARAGVDLPAGLAPSIQERAWSSPIWVKP